MKHNVVAFALLSLVAGCGEVTVAADQVDAQDAGAERVGLQGSGGAAGAQGDSGASGSRGAAGQQGGGGAGAPGGGSGAAAAGSGAGGRGGSGAGGRGGGNPGTGDVAGPGTGGSGQGGYAGAGPDCSGGQACPANSTCQLGACRCAGGMDFCGGDHCIDLSGDTENCGGCGWICPVGRLCASARCQ